MSLAHQLTRTPAPPQKIHPYIHSSGHTGVRQQRQQEVNSFDLSAAIDALSHAQATTNAVHAAENSALRAQLSTLMGADSPVTATVQAIATDMTARTMGLMSTASANDVRLEAIAGSLGSLTATVDSQLDAAAAANTAAQATVTATLTATAQSSEYAPPRPSAPLISLVVVCRWMPCRDSWMMRAPLVDRARTLPTHARGLTLSFPPHLAHSGGRDAVNDRTQHGPDLRRRPG